MTDEGLHIVRVRRVHSKAYLETSDGNTVCMPRALLRDRPYKSGMPFDPAEHENFVAEHSLPYAMNKAGTLLSMRNRSERELTDALKLCGYSEHIIAEVMERVSRYGYVDDERFAQQWVSSRGTHGSGPRKLRAELMHKGVSSEIIERALDGLSSGDVRDSALLAAKRAARGKDLSDPDDRRKLTAALLRRGYSFENARQALESLRKQAEEDE